MHIAERVSILLFALILNLGLSGIAAASDWRANYIVHENSESPDQRYAVLVLSKQAAIDGDQTEGNTTYLADLQTHKALGEIRGTDYFQGQNHRDMQVVFGDVNPTRSSRAASLARRVSASIRESSS